MPNIGLGVQLYTIRQMSANNFADSLKRVAEIGYKNVELAGYGNLKKAADVKKALDDAGLKCPSGHYALDLLQKEVERIMEEAQLLGMQHVVVPFLAEDKRPKDADGWKALGKQLDEVGSYFHGVGIELAYHNHAFEFEHKFDDGKFPYDLIFETTAPHLVKAEIDVYWVAHAGQDPVAFINKLGDRVRLLHLKDLAEGADKKFAPVGTGIMDFKAILAAAEKNNVRWGFVEQDQTYGMPPLEAIKTSFENLKKLGLDPNADPLNPR